MILMKDIIREGTPTLRATAKKVTFPASQEEQNLGLEMMEFLENSQDEKIAEKYHLRAGVGLAAPQVNVSKRMAAVLVPDNQGNIVFKEILYNPRILRESVKRAALNEGEGCLSVDRDVAGLVVRTDRITLEFFDADGTRHEVKLRDYPAIVVQHEIDHLNGTLFYDHIDSKSPFKIPENTVIIE
ncbi:peptide deformylase [Xylocopilactobacillus apicola]|uniref:Peptide deformylase n=1 Tax=Xylocopilactobacillus apicola TaxID=2932184 RepID=A0AAU9CWA7_9LACO|nr:peptide deformylase [Xylocopilactobacillus apicola]BDR58244.1 peptide deformylase [Xylocopilactobacillus apicola]